MFSYETNTYLCISAIEIKREIQFIEISWIQRNLLGKYFVKVLSNKYIYTILNIHKSNWGINTAYRNIATSAPPATSILLILYWLSVLSSTFTVSFTHQEIKLIAKCHPSRRQTTRKRAYKNAKIRIRESNISKFLKFGLSVLQKIVLQITAYSVCEELKNHLYFFLSSHRKQNMQ